MAKNMKHIDRYAHKLLRDLIIEITSAKIDSEDCVEFEKRIIFTARDISEKMVIAVNDDTFKFSKKHSRKIAEKNLEDLKEKVKKEKAEKVSDDISELIREKLKIKKEDIKVVRLDLSNKETKELSDIIERLSGEK